MCIRDRSILELRQQGVTEFQVACDPGVGLYAGEIVHALAEQERNIRLVCVMPHEGQATKWTPQLRERYFDMLACCDEVRCLAPRAQPGGQLLAYQKIVRDTNMTLAAYALPAAPEAVSYTHLDVYKRQLYFIMGMFKDKDYDQVIGMTAPLAQHIITAVSYTHLDVYKRQGVMNTL